MHIYIKKKIVKLIFRIHIKEEGQTGKTITRMKHILVFSVVILSTTPSSKGSPVNHKTIIAMMSLVMLSTSQACSRIFYSAQLKINRFHWEYGKHINILNGDDLV